MAEWIWVATQVAIEAHREQLIEHGAGQGVRDLGLLDSDGTRSKPRGLWRTDSR